MRQWFLVGLALALWSALGRPGWLELLGCYLAGLVLTELGERFEILPSLSPRAWAALALVLSLPGLRFAYSARERMLERAGLVGIKERALDRLALGVRWGAGTSIAPRLLSTAQPQTFFVHSSALKEAVVAFGEGKRVKAEALGGGLFRVDYDPRRDGVPEARDGVASVGIGGSKLSSKELQVVTPLAHPRWFCRSPSGARAATPSDETDELIVVDAATTTPQRIPVGDGPVACEFVDEQHVAISHRHAAELWVVDLSGAEPKRIATLAGGPLGRLVFDAPHNQLLVARGGAAPELLQISWPGLELVAETGLAVAPDWVALCGEGLVISSRVDASLRAFIRREDHFIEVKQLLMGRPAATLAVDPRDARIFVAVTDYQAPFSPPQLGNHFVQDQLLIVNPRGLTLQQRVLTARRSERQTKPGDMDQGGSPLGIWPLRDGRLAVTFAGTDELWRLSLPEANIEAQRFDGEAFYTPHGVVELSDGTLWLSSPAAGALAKLSPGSSAGFSSKPRAPQIMALTPSAEKLAKANAAALARRIGEHGFYESTRAGISCQSCHMHADSDYAAYNLGDHRLIPTLSVLGMFGTSPYLRDGSYPRLADLDDVAQELYRGYARVQPGRRYTLQAYVESLPRATDLASASKTRDPEAEKRGYAVFQRAGCDRCHAPPAFTNLGQLPLAALFPKTAAELKKPEQLDVPSLLSVSATAPYLHDGRARTLRSVITEHNPDNLHGNTRELREADVDDLVKFLSAL